MTSITWYLSLYIIDVNVLYDSNLTTEGSRQAIAKWDGLSLLPTGFICITIITWKGQG